MAETTEFVSTIRVKDLISAFESKSDQAPVEFSRPRARSVGNILAKNVVVRQNEFNTLEDIEKALRKLDTNLNFYEVYNKEKHVAFQEQLFNILTSIVNIEDHGEDASTKKKQLISKTQTLVSFLNQKLPSNVNQLVNSATNNYKYTPYSTRAKETVEDGNKANKQSFAIYSENTKSVDVPDSREDVFVSVRKLKENFQPKNETKTEEPPKNDKFKAIPVSNGNLEEPPKKEKAEEVPENVSVSRLRNLFEKRSEETSKGLGIITDEKPTQDKILYSSNVNIPYTERNLGNVRLQRSVSGNYMNYVGLLKRVDISKSTSELNKEFSDKTDEKNYKNSSSNESDAESEESVDTVEERKSVQEIMKIYLQQSVDNPDFNKAKSTPNIYDKEKVSILDAPEDIKVRYSTTVTVNNTKQPTNTFLVNNETSKEGAKEVEVKYSTVISDDAKDSTPKNDLATIEGAEEEVNYSRAASAVISTKENVATLNGPAEEKVTFATATSDDHEETKELEQVATVESTEEKVKYSTPESDSIPTKDVATLNGTTEEDETSSSTITPGETENTIEADISGTEEETVEYSTADTENVAQKTIENAVVSEPVNKQVDVTDSSPTAIGSERSEGLDFLIDEEIDKIDVEQTLADADIVLNEEELKNADNEFEKLLENSAADKTVA